MTKRQPRKSKKVFRQIHVEDRHGEGWPRPAGYNKQWTGWLTYREYNVIEFYARYGVNNIYSVGKHLGVMGTSAERIYHYMREAGILTGPVENFAVTPMARILFDMTDQFILDMDFEEETA